MTAVPFLQAPGAVALAALHAVLPLAAPSRVLAHGAGGAWDEIIIIALFLVIVGAIWVFVHTSTDDEAGESPETEDKPHDT